MMETTFSNSSGKRHTISEVVQEVLRFMAAQPEHIYKVTIGTDSERSADLQADFVTAVVVHRIGNGGRYFFRRLETGPFHTLRDRIIREVLISLDTGKTVLTELEQATRGESFPAWKFEIHVDVGDYGPTKTMVQEVVAMVRAHNFPAITKPRSYAASSVADRHV